MGIESKTKDLQIFAGGSKKADWDVGLAVDAIKIAPKLDAIIIVSGDGDFIPLVEYLRTNMGCQVEAASFGKSTSSKLKEAVDDFIDLDENPRKYLLGQVGGQNHPAQRQGGRGRGKTQDNSDLAEMLKEAGEEL
jgi:uncharacterized LabA/DUF88 family protein